MANKKESGGGFDKTTDFKWFGIGILVFILVWIMPAPESMEEIAKTVTDPSGKLTLAQKTFNIKIIIALLGCCTVFFATEALPMPAVALFIGLVQLFFGVTPAKDIVATYAHDAVWFIAGSLAMGATMVKYGLDKRIGMLVMNLSGTKVRNVVLGILIGTAIPSAFISEASIAPMFLPIVMALYTLTSKKIGDATQLGKLLMMSIAIGCMVGAPMSPTGGARNAIMIGFLSNLGYEVSFMQWMILGSFYTLFLGLFFAFLLPFLYKPEIDDLSDAVETLKSDLDKHGKMTREQWMVSAIALLMVIAWITDKDFIKPILGFPLGLGGVAMTGTVLFMLLGLTSWADYEKNISWGVIVLYAGAISLGAVFKSSGAAEWLASVLISGLEALNISGGYGLAIMVALIGALMTNLMSAGATVAVIGPVVLEMAVQTNTNPVIVGVALAIATSMAFWLVIGTPASSVVYSAGLLEAKDFIRMATFAWPAALLIIIAMIFYWVGLGLQPLNINEVIGGG